MHISILKSCQLQVQQMLDDLIELKALRAIGWKQKRPN